MQGMLEVSMAAAFGVLLQEVLHWAELRRRLASAELSEMFRSSQYWVVFLATVGVTGGAAYVWYGGSKAEAVPRLQDVLIFGAALPALFKKGIAAAVGGDPTLGGATPLGGGTLNGATLGSSTHGDEQMPPALGSVLPAPPSSARPGGVRPGEDRSFLQRYLAL